MPTWEDLTTEADVLEWERVLDNADNVVTCTDEQTFVAKVPGGRLVRVCSVDSRDFPARTVALVFIPSVKEDKAP